MPRNTSFKRLVTLGVLIAISCSIFSSPTASTPTKMANQEVSVIITASQGGELTLPDKTVLKIPAGSLQTDTRVSLRKITVEDLPVAPEELSIVGGTYDINLGTASLEKPATLEIPFDPTLLPNGAEPSQVFLSYYDEITKEWVYAGGEVDTNRNVVVLEITHASWWMPTTWNWGAWIAVLNKFLRVSIVNWIEAVQLLTDDCPQAGDYVQVDSSQARNLVQGCVEQDDIERPVLRVINPKAFFFEIKPISGGNGYPSPTLLSPGEDLKFEASTSDPSPLIIEAEMTQRSGWYLVIHMVLTMLPGANEFGIQGRDVACITERLADVSEFASAVESLLVDHNGAAAGESLSKFLTNGDAVRRFISAADDCHFGPAPTWSVEGIQQIGGAVSTIMSATDYIANYFAGNTYAQLSFTWTSSAIPLTLDMASAESIARWINYGLQNGDSSVFNPLLNIMPKFTAFSNPDCWVEPCPPCQDLMGQWCDISRDEFIHEVENRIQSRPQCFYWVHLNGLLIETFKWDPLWVWPWGKADLIHFNFNQQDGEYYLTSIEFIPKYYDEDKHLPWMADTPCP